MKYLKFTIIIFPIFCFSQIDSNIFTLKIGKFNFAPKYNLILHQNIIDNNESKTHLIDINGNESPIDSLPTLEPIEYKGSLIIYFKSKYDTILYINNVGKESFKIEQNDHYGFECWTDSIKFNQLNN